MHSSSITALAHHSLISATTATASSARPGETVELTYARFAPYVPDRSETTAELVLAELEATGFAAPVYPDLPGDPDGGTEQPMIRHRLSTVPMSSPDPLVLPGPALRDKLTGYQKVVGQLETALHHQQQPTAATDAATWFAANEDRLHHLATVAWNVGMYGPASAIGAAAEGLAALFGRHHRLLEAACLTSPLPDRRWRDDTEFTEFTTAALLALGSVTAAEFTALLDTGPLDPDEPAGLRGGDRQAAGARALAAHGHAQRAAGDLAAALAAHTRAVALAERAGQPATLATCRAARALTLADHGRLAEATAELEYAVPLLASGEEPSPGRAPVEMTGDAVGAALARIQLARLHRLRGCTTAALAAAGTALGTLQDQGDTGHHAAALAEFVCAAVGPAPELARELLPRALRLCHEAGRPGLARDVELSVAERSPG
ncbi:MULTISPECIES: hypothetical protein [unclassified Crossiella]|uniref:hypothetical protein n=1 Tax=unclassified Crossiella TaxID=2620835 RepID=UPI001FFE5DC4|nr:MULTISPECIES: hypothetical protein [unclassified Crossiella]MCK2240948.1 hypothetical protein [Crossiella sp. S99.2]MCK2253908.1 hypothetical protein [Crossiella sp. S99.1]